MNNSFEYYKIFYYVARYLNISKAAKVLSTGQPNVTRTIKKLESSLGCELFVRTNSGVILTKQGETLYQHIKEAFRQIDIGESKIEEETKMAKRKISIGLSVATPYNLINAFIIPAIGAYEQDYPQTHLQIVCKPTPELIADVAKGLLDMVILTTSDHQPIVESKERIIMNFKDTIIAGNKFRDDFKEPASMEYILGFPIIGFSPDTETFALYDHINATKGLDYHVDIEVPNYDQALAFVKNNMGLGCVPIQLAASAIKGGDIFVVKTVDPLPERRLSVVKNEALGNTSAAILEDYIIKHSALLNDPVNPDKNR
ncbi:MAG: LysR family transcriptional regulator [Lachnospiraceae bacterium]|nr:LysR family transcriptional regulator [Lachnospiraceae bacterium]